MTGDDTAHLIYLIIIGGAVVAWYLAQNRLQLGKTLKMAVIWVILFAGTAAGIALFESITKPEARQTIVSGEAIELIRRRDGHYYATLEADGEPVFFLVDTGASGVVLATQDARKIGIDVDNLPFLGYATTANGEVRTASVILETLSMGPHVMEQFQAYVNEGALDTSLLGMDFLSKFDRIEIRDSRMILYP